jgi:RNA polymerase sigma factor for flagellar operon FliA
MRVTPPVLRDQAERDSLVLAHVDLVKAMANRLCRRLPSQVEAPDLISVGVLGLIDAATRYQPSLGVPFEAFARRRIHGAMLDALRGLDWVPRSVRRLQRDVDRVITQLRHALGREPETEEIATALGVSVEVYGDMLDELRSAELATVRSPGGGDRDGFNEIEMAIDDGEGPFSLVERNELRRSLATALGCLPERERHILALYYEHELTLAEIGQVIGVGESRVSQLRSQAIARLRTLMRDSVAGGRSARAS